MKHLTHLFLITVSFAYNQLLFAQACDSNSLIIEQVWASDTDPNIPWELTRHHTFYNPDCVPKNVLLVHLVGTGDDPYSTLYFPALAANYGFHVLSLKYPNDVSAQSICNVNTDPDCHYKFRKETIEGVDYSPEITVDSVNSIVNRLLRLLQYMDANNPGQNWGQYYNGTVIDWTKVMVSGHSQGGGHAAVMGIDRPLQRILMFASPNDYSTTFSQSAPWTSMAHTAQDEAYYSFNNINDDLIGQYSWQYTAALNLGAGGFGDTVNIETNGCPYNFTHNLYTDRDVNGVANHTMLVYDNGVPLDGNGKPVFEEVWKYMLGIECSAGGINDQKTSAFTMAPNPVNDVLNITFTGIADRTVEVFTIDGQRLLSTDANQANIHLDLRLLSSGIYQLVVMEPDGTRTSRKIVR